MIVCHTYKEAVREASADKAFIRRTLEAHADFAAADAEVETLRGICIPRGSEVMQT